MEKLEKKMNEKFFFYKKNQLESLILEYEQNRTKLGYWKFVANENCTAEIGELSSVENSFWANQASKNA